MILYKNDPSLGLKTVTTVQGDTEYRRNCKFIKGQYYVMNRDCIQLPNDDTWYRLDGGNIVMDHEKKQWVTKKAAERLKHGLVGFKKDTPEVGYFSENPYNNVIVRVSGMGKMPCMNVDLLKDSGYFEDVATGVWHNAREVGSSNMRQMRIIRNELRFTDRGYNIEDNEVDFRRKQDLYRQFNPAVSKECFGYARLLGDTTFGAEIEIAQGYLPDHLQSRFGVVICRDGSIDGGPELVTIPLQGAKGLLTLKNLSEALHTRGEVNINCAFHLHLGNIPTDRLFISAFYTLCLKVQDELFTMFPGYKADPTGVKRKNYNQKLERMGIHPLVDKTKDGLEQYIQDVCTKLFVWLGDGRVTPDQYNNRKVRKHPESQKWNRRSRYFWANLMNMFYSTRNTVEFRLHGPTTNAQKMINWLFICNAMVRYAQKHADKIISSKGKITVKQVLDYYREAFPKDTQAAFLSDYLYAYFKERKDRFEKDIKAGDRVSMWDISEDKEYRFIYKGVKELF